MLPNSKYYGNPEDWIKASTKPYASDDAANKIPSYSTINGGITANKLEVNKPLDNSICYAAIAEDSPIAKTCCINGTNYNDPLFEYEGNIDFFWGYVDTTNGIARSTSYTINVNDLSDERETDKLFLVPESQNAYPSNNVHGHFTPYVSIIPRNFVLLIYIECDTLTFSDRRQIALDDYINNTYGYSPATHPNITAIHVAPVAGNDLTGERYFMAINNNGGMTLAYNMPYDLPQLNGIYDYWANRGNVKTTVKIWGNVNTLAYNNTYQYVNGKDGTFNTANNKLNYYKEYGDGEWILHCVASLGLFFAVKRTTAYTGALDDPDMYCGIIDDNGLCHGDYSKGTENRKQKQFNWTSTNDSTYNPDKPVPPTPSTDPITPYQPGLTLAGAGTGLWAMTKFQVEEFITDVFGGEAEKLKEKLILFGSNPMNAVISLRWYPMAWSSTRSGPVILGTTEVSKAHQYPLINSTASSYYSNSGTLNIMDAYDRNFYNSRHIQARLWLPFYGFYELPSTILLSKQIELELHFNLPDELAVWIISFDNVIYDFCECSMGIDIPLTGSNAAAITEAKRQAAISIASQIASTAATTVLGVTGLRGLTGTANYLAEGIDILASDLGYGSAGLEAQTYLSHRAGGQFNKTSLAQGIGTASGIIGAGINIANTVHQTRLEIANLKTNLPFHGAAGQTTFLNFPMYPYIQIFRNNIMSTYDEEEYQLKVGHACDVWAQLSEMPDNSLLQTTGMANMSSNGMEMVEVQELNSILQSGFYK